MRRQPVVEQERGKIGAGGDVAPGLEAQDSLEAAGAVPADLRGGPTLPLCPKVDSPNCGHPSCLEADSLNVG